MGDRTALRVRKREQTRLDIVRAAIALFREHGFDAATLDAIADRANYSKSTVLRYFGTKEDIAFVDVFETVANLGTDIGAFEQAETPYLTLRNFGTTAATEFADKMTDLHVECIGLWFEVPALQRRYAELMIDSERLYAEFLAAKTGLPATDVECQVLAAAVIGVVRAAFNQVRSKDPEAIKAALDRGFAVLENGIFAATSPIAAATG